LECVGKHEFGVFVDGYVWGRIGRKFKTLLGEPAVAPQFKTLQASSGTPANPATRG
jgi:hypothetical protein